MFSVGKKKQFQYWATKFDKDFDLDQVKSKTKAQR